MTAELDPRRHAYRADLADATLRGQVQAPHFTAGERHEITAAIAPLHAGPQSSAMRLSEALKGEHFTVFDQQGGWSWGQLATDSYVGYIPSAALGSPGPKATHQVAVLQAHVFNEPDIKSLVLDRLPMMARLAVAGRDGCFAALAGGGYMMAAHLKPLGPWSDDYVAVAEQFTGAPYLWGGRSNLGLDCSALVQLSLAAAGIAAPRDSDMQAEELFSPLDPGAGYEHLRRGDLLFWKGHVGVISAPGRLLHANGHHMLTVSEPLHRALERITESSGPPTGARGAPR